MLVNLDEFCVSTGFSSSSVNTAIDKKNPLHHRTAAIMFDQESDGYNTWTEANSEFSKNKL